MIQSPVKYFLCQMHKKKIISYCLNQNCKQNRLLCHDCIENEEHIQHQKDLDEFDNLETKIEETKLKYQNLNEQLHEILKDVFTLYNRIKKGIDDKYNSSFQMINFLSNEKLIQQIDNMIQCNQYQSTMQKQMKQNCQEFEQKLKNYLIELQLDTQTSNVISDKNTEMAEKLYNQGYILYKNQKDYDGAIKLFDQALNYDRNHINSLCCKGESLRLKDLYKDALEMYDKALSIDPKHVDSLSGKGKCLGKMGQHRNAILWFDKALSINPNDVDSLNRKGSALRLLKQHEEALECQKKAYAINPNNTSILFEYGETLRMLDYLDQALQYFDKALSIDQNHQLTLACKGACLREMKRFNEALVCLNKAIKINPKHAFSLNELEICQEELEELSQ